MQKRAAHHLRLGDLFELEGLSPTVKSRIRTPRWATCCSVFPRLYSAGRAAARIDVDLGNPGRQKPDQGRQGDLPHGQTKKKGKLLVITSNTRAPGLDDCPRTLSPETLCARAWPEAGVPP